MRTLFLAVTSVALALAQHACQPASDWDAAAIDEGTRRWVSVYRDKDYRIFVDTANLGTRRIFGAYTVWFRADHRLPHFRRGHYWNREVSQALVSCSKRQFKVIRADLSLGAARPVSQQRTTPLEMEEQPWHDVQQGTPDDASLRATCWLLEQRRARPVTAAGTTR